jgi:hypothetical protein
MILAASTKFGNLGLAGFGPFVVGPLIAQPGAPNSAPTYVRYQAAYNQTEYDQIFTNKWYLAANIPTTGVTFCNNGAKGCPAENSIDVKSSWIDMSVVPAANQSRYYTRQAWVFDPAAPSGQACSQKTVGLVGLHIAQDARASGVDLVSFEQVDNNVQPMPATAPAPFNVTRTMALPASTQTTNSQYQKLLQNTPWQFYQLVLTQWPLNTPPDPNAHCGKVSVTFQGLSGPPPSSNKTVCVPPPPPSANLGDGTCPGSGCTSFANVTMETTRRRSGDGVHELPQRHGRSTDFLWSLAVNARLPPPSPPAAWPRARPGRAAREKSSIRCENCC